MGGFVSDGDAVHKSVAAEINGLTSKASPVANDIVIIEDSADGWKKKKVARSALTASGGIGAVVDDTSPQLGGDLNLNGHDILALGVHISPTELLRLDGVTSGIQAQLDLCIHENVAGEIHAIDAKATPVVGDEVLIEDSADSYAKKRSTLSQVFVALGAIRSAIASQIHAITEKTTPVAADEFVLEDSADSWNKKRMTFANLIAGFLKNIVEDTTPQLGGNLDINSFGFSLQGELGETVTIRQIVYLKDDAHWYVADADDLDKSIGLLGFAVAGGSAHDTREIKLFGHLAGFSGLTVGEVYYLSTSPGGILIRGSKPSGSGDTVRVVARATTSAAIWIDIDPAWSVNT